MEQRDASSYSFRYYLGVLLPSICKVAYHLRDSVCYRQWSPLWNSPTLDRTLRAPESSHLKLDFLDRFTLNTKDLLGGDIDMANINVVAIAAVVAIFVGLYECFHRLFLSPLSKVPAPHWSCHIAPFWLWWAKLTHNENRLVYENHMSQGKALRLAPGLLSLNCFEGGLKQIYLGGFPKTEFYFRGFANYK